MGYCPRSFKSLVSCYSWSVKVPECTKFNLGRVEIHKFSWGEGGMPLDPIALVWPSGYKQTHSAETPLFKNPGSTPE